MAQPEEQDREGFFDRVYEIVAQIPYGKVVSYGQIAKMLGNPRGARLVGWAMHVCPEGLPWQRVVSVDGAITGGQWAELRRELLIKEGVEFLPDGRVDLEACRWTSGFPSNISSNFPPNIPQDIEPRAQ